MYWTNIAGTTKISKKMIKLKIIDTIKLNPNTNIGTYPNNERYMYLIKYFIKSALYLNMENEKLHMVIIVVRIL